MFPQIVLALYLFGAATAIPNGQSLLSIISQGTDNQTPSTPKSSIVSPNDIKQRDPSRPERAISYSSADGHCPVLPDTPVTVIPRDLLNGSTSLVIPDDRLTFFDFRHDQREPLTYPNQTLECPEDDTATWEGWTKGGKLGPNNLKASCPWIWVNKVMFDLESSYEIYPKYVKESKCLCRSHCMGYQGMRCRDLWREEVFYKKIGCNGEYPIFKKYLNKIKVGCYCSL